MVKFYVSRIKNRKMTLDDVPTKWREQVRQELKNQGLLDVEDEVGKDDE